MDSHQHDYILKDNEIASNEKKIGIVVVITFVTMFAEIIFGHITGSMALLADGWHMGSHVGALGISLIAYRMARSNSLKKYFSFGTGKFVPLGGYSSAILLAIVAIMMVAESVERLLNPDDISFNTAIYVAIIGLIINLASALILWKHHEHDDDHEDAHEHEHEHAHEHEHNHQVHDHNHHSALVHVIADAFTSILAIIALVVGKFTNILWFDSLIGILGAIVILKWAIGLGKSTAWELLDGDAKKISKNSIEKIFSGLEGIEILDLHIWRIAPKAHACEVVIKSNQHHGTDFYRTKILEIIEIEHLIIEERVG